jgi:hypothetical protein
VTPERREALHTAAVHLRFATSFLRAVETTADSARARDTLKAVEGHIREALSVLSVPA